MWNKVFKVRHGDILYLPFYHFLYKAASRPSARARTLCPDTKGMLFRHRGAPSFVSISCAVLLTLLCSFIICCCCTVYRAQVFVRASQKCYIHIGARAQAPNPGTKSGGSLKIDMKVLSIRVIRQTRMTDLWFWSHWPTRPLGEISAIYALQRLTTSFLFRWVNVL